MNANSSVSLATNSSLFEQSNSTFNSTALKAEDESNHYARDVFLIILYSITGFLAFYGNYLVCRIIFARNSTLKNSTNILVGNLAISDVLGGATIFLQWIFCWEYVLIVWKIEFPCALVKSLQVLSFYMSSLIMMLIAIERFMSIMYPLSPPLNSKLYVTITWVLTSLFVASSIGSAKIFKYFTSDRLISCQIVLEFTRPFDSKKMRSQRVWGIWLGQYVIPLVVTGILYAIIARKIWTQKKVGASTAASQEARDAKKKKIVLMLIVVVVVFALCWLPLHALNFTDYVIKQLENKKGTGNKGKLCNDSTTYFVLYWLGISSCCYNPFIYWWMNPDFRRGFKKLLPKFIAEHLSKDYEVSDGNIQIQSKQGTELTNPSSSN
ncbi:putative G-protein coupled receptor 83-like protein [Dinothrombium tinctorium]|uniref:Putative G-protein coupled receptor 83-like protein n=1 Tax=Dinothrombium tinctorium TaxID=1965070 RepID=A0A3S3RG51_9ACAR|nr:putative G-protein coupled receptor 83-like protein [Dinothrombium tinctorium]RWS00600.1 putative G-protein coupled receptor 83-like protein [Dinothrombium tinctorium]RWS01276.1 putative G-protein coupled receptor 83-like protein [Dinothrombium tinctorium]RWS11021.1 putative G-protein coupled receptor 83-like protein [Dinothrombium tinctorium]